MDREAQATERSEKVRLIIVDDHDLVRSGLRYMLTREPDLELVGEAKDGGEALELCRRLRPDLVLMDVSMPEMDGIAATQAIKQKYPATRVIIITIHENPDYLQEALKAGANGYILKDSTKPEVLAAVRKALQGETPLDSQLAAQLLRQVVGEDNGTNLPPEPEERPTPLHEALTQRELEVLRLLAQGQTNQKIADNLMFSVHTVKVYVRRIIAKLEVSDRTQAAVRAVELGLLDSASGDSPSLPHNPAK